MQTPSDAELYLIMRRGYGGKTIKGTRVFVHLTDAIEFLTTNGMKPMQSSSGKWYVSGGPYTLYHAGPDKDPKSIPINLKLFGHSK